MNLHIYEKIFMKKLGWKKPSSRDDLRNEITAEFNISSRTKIAFIESPITTISLSNLIIPTIFLEIISWLSF